MAHDDMHVVVYKILAYLYDCLKNGEAPQRSMLVPDGAMLSIPYTYWVVIIEELVARGYVRGFTVTRDIVGTANVDIRNPTITMDGVDFLQENSRMRKALDFLRDVKCTLPFI